MLGNLRNRLLRWHRLKSEEEKEQFKDRIRNFQLGRFQFLQRIPVSLLFGGDLRLLSMIYMSDKWGRHWYAQHYQNIFREYRRKRINILEIGIGGYDDPRKGGGSLRMWRDYFPRGRVYGVDIEDKSPHSQGRIRTFQGSQADAQFLNWVVKEIGEVDIIIDDGSHRCEHILFTFQHLFPHLAEGGVYAVKDTQTSYWANYGGNEENRNDLATSMGYFKSLVDGLNWEEFRGRYDPTYLDQNIASITFHHNLIIIRKGSNREQTNPPQT